jgi:adenylate cyclase
MTAERVERRLAAILAADVVGFARLMAVDEAGTLARLKALRRDVIDPAIAAHTGRLVKLMGDGMLVVFHSSVDALGCAVAIQKALAEHAATVAENQRLALRIGVNVGDVIVDGDDIYGDGVNIAARLETLAEPGGICLSRVAAEHVRGRLDVNLVARGSQQVKPGESPIEVFAVAAGGAAVPRPSAERLSIAVLAFDNMSGDADQEFFSDGIAEDIITDLSKLGGLHVIARNSSFVYKRRPVSVREIGNELGVRYVLEGSVRKAGSRIRVNAQLIDTTTGGHVWANRFDRELIDIFAVQDELTRNIVGALQLSLTAGEDRRLGRRRQVLLEAYQLYLRGREQSLLHTPAGNRAARQLFERAIASEPEYAAAHAMIAFLHVVEYINAWSPEPEEALALARSIAERALTMDPDEAQCHFALSCVRFWSGELEEALLAAERCVALSPSSIEGHLAVAHAQIFLGNPAAAVRIIEAALGLDPLYPEVGLQFLAEAHLSLGNLAAAARALEDRLVRNPDSVSAHALLAAVQGEQGRLEEARASWATALNIDPGWSLEWRRRILPFRDPVEHEKRLSGLRRAGIIDSECTFET